MSQSLSGPERFITLFAWSLMLSLLHSFPQTLQISALRCPWIGSLFSLSPIIALTLSSSSLRLAAPAPCHLATCTLPALAPSQVPGCWIFSTKAEVGGGKVAKLPSNKIFNCARCCCTLMAHCKSIANTLCSAKFAHLHMCTQFKQQPTAHRM